MWKIVTIALIASTGAASACNVGDPVVKSKVGKIRILKNTGLLQEDYTVGADSRMCIDETLAKMLSSGGLLDKNVVPVYFRLGLVDRAGFVFLSEVEEAVDDPQRPAQ